MRKDREMQKVRSFLGLIFSLMFLVWAVPASNAATVTFQNGLNGYDGTEDNTLAEGTPPNFDNYNYGASGTCFVGEWATSNQYKTSRTILRFNGLQSLQGQIISVDSVKLVLTVFDGSAEDYSTAGGNYGFGITVHSLGTDNWTEGVKDGAIPSATTAPTGDGSNWPYQNHIAGPVWSPAGGGAFGAAMSSAVIAPASDNADGATMEFTIDPALVQQWINGGTNAGLLLKADSENSATNKYRRFYTSENTNTAWRPQLVITYTPKPGPAIVTFQDGVNGFAGTEDNTLAEGTPPNFDNYNYGASGTCFVGEWFTSDQYKTSRTILRFNGLQSLQGQIISVDSVKLVLTVFDGSAEDYSTAGGNYGFGISVHSLGTDNWTEGVKEGAIPSATTAPTGDGSNWAYQNHLAGPAWSPAGGGAFGIAMSSVVAPASDNADGATMEFDINPALVQQWINGGTNAGLLLKADSEDSATNKYRRFYTSENGSTAFRPQLVITYTPKPGPATVTFQEGFNGFAGTEDTTLSSGATGSPAFKNRNYGATGDTRAGEFITYETCRPIYRFNIAGLLPSSFVVNSAKLVLTVAYSNTNDFELSIHEVTAANALWVEGVKDNAAPSSTVAPTGDGATWTHQRYLAGPAWSGGGAAGGGTINPAMATVQANSANRADGAKMEFDINPALVQQWLNGGTNAGVLIKAATIEGSTTDYYRRFYSSEAGTVNAAKRPQLVITYTPKYRNTDSVNAEFKRVINTIWSARKQYMKDSINSGFAANYSIALYDIQPWTSNLLRYASKSKEYGLIDELCDLYLQAYSPEYNTVNQLWPACSGCGENKLYSSQFLYVISSAVNAVIDVPSGQRTANMNSLISTYVPILTSHIDRWVNGSASAAGFSNLCGDGPYNHTTYLTKLKNKEFAASPSYCNAVNDQDMWVISIVAESLLANSKNATLFPMGPTLKTNLLNYMTLASDLLESRLTVSSLTGFYGESVSGLNFGFGEWTDYPDNEFAGYTGSTTPVSPADVNKVDSGWDISHATRFVNVFEALYNAKSATGQTFPDAAVLEGLANQFIYGAFNKDLARPRFYNYMDGTNGWYSPDSKDYAPYKLTYNVIQSPYFYWSIDNDDIRTLGNILWNMVDAVSYVDDAAGSYPDAVNDGANYDASGKIGGCLEFPNASGTTTRIITMDTGRWTSAQGSIEFWLKVPYQGSRNILEISKSYDDFLSVRFDGSAGTVRLLVKKAGSNWIDLTSNVNVQTDTWHHIVITQDGSGAQIYTDGVLDASGGFINSSDWTAHIAGGTAWGPASGNLVFGYGRWGNEMVGRIDEFRLYNRALSPAEVAQHYAGTFSNNANLVMYLPMNNVANTDSASRALAKNLITDYDITVCHKQYSIGLLRLLPSLALEVKDNVDAANLDGLGAVNFGDLKLFAEDWAFTGMSLWGDIDGDDDVDMKDFAVFAKYWLMQ